MFVVLLMLCVPGVRAAEHTMQCCTCLFLHVYLSAIAGGMRL